MADEARIDLHHGASRCLLGLIDAAAGGLADWSEFDAEAARWGIEVRELSREGLAALIESSTRVIPTQRATYRSLYHDFTEQRELAFARTGKREKWGLSGVPRDESVAAG